MRICFVVSDVRAQAPTFAGIYLAHAAHRRGADVRFVSVDDLSFLDNNTILASTRRVRHGDYARPADYARALTSDEAVVEEDNLGSFDVIFLRYNPGRDGSGRVGAPLIDFAWRLRLGGTLVVNDPEGLRRAGSRMYLGEGRRGLAARSRGARSAQQLRRGGRAWPGPAVCKPWQPRGGEHVFVVKRRQVSNLNQIITTVTKHGYAIAQEYVPEIEKGEKRLLLLGAEPIRVGTKVAIYRRHTTIGNPQSTATTEAASRRSRCEFGPAEARICDLMRPKLLADGLYCVGVDIGGDTVLAVTVLTPGGIHAIHALSGMDVSAIIVRALDGRLRLRAASRTHAAPRVATRPRNRRSPG